MYHSACMCEAALAVTVRGPTGVTPGGGRGEGGGVIWACDLSRSFVRSGSSNRVIRDEIDQIFLCRHVGHLSEGPTKLAHECKVGALIVSNAYAFPNAELGLQLLREQRVETSWWNPDGTSSLWLYRRGAPDPRGGSGGRGGGSFVVRRIVCIRMVG